MILRRIFIACVSTLVVGGVLAGPAASAAPATVWICRPGMPGSACPVDYSTTRYNANGHVTKITNAPDKYTKIDCFYVYPTTSDEIGPQADFTVSLELRSMALYQAARFGSECRVFAPVYRQITVPGLFNPNVTPEMREIAYQDVRNAWLDYLAHDNFGRGVVFIGHSQGAGVLRRLIREEVDPKPEVRSLLVSAILLGGNVLVKKGQDIGGDFQNIPACRSNKQFGCVIAFSTFDAPPPPDSLFGRSRDPAFEVLCTNPASLRRGGSGKVTSVYPTEPFAPLSLLGKVFTQMGLPPVTATTTWVEYRNAYRAQCTSGDANVLEVTPLGTSPLLKPVPSASWGLHLADANIALGNLVDIVHDQARQWVRHKR